MTLLLHCGYHKTASSYLQSCFASQNKILLKNGIHYPDDPRQKDAAQGIPTAGNGAELCKALYKLDAKASKKLLERYFSDAERRGSKSVLLSTEGFFVNFADPKSKKMLLDTATQSGFTSIRALIFFRSPIDHAISVYCHRAASGKIPAFAQWMDEVFETPKLMECFADHFDSAGIDWHIRLFQPKKQNITKVAFSDWLKIPDELDLSSLPANVNVSVSIGESFLLREFHRHSPNCGRHLSALLKVLPREQKSADSAQRKMFEQIASIYFQRHQSVLDKVNQLLPADQKLIISPEASKEVEQATVPTFSSAQVIACAEGLQAHAKSRTVLGRFERFLTRTKKCFANLIR